MQYFTFFRYKFSFLPECSYSPTHSFPSISNHFPVYLLKKEGSFFGLMWVRRNILNNMYLMIENVDSKQIQNIIYEKGVEMILSCSVRCWLTENRKIYSPFLDNVLLASGKSVHSTVVVVFFSRAVNNIKLMRKGMLLSNRA